MKLIKLSMGCLTSRSTIAPSESDEINNNNGNNISYSNDFVRSNSSDYDATVDGKQRPSSNAKTRLTQEGTQDIEDGERTSRRQAAISKANGMKTGERKLDSGDSGVVGVSSRDDSGTRSRSDDYMDSHRNGATRSVRVTGDSNKLKKSSRSRNEEEDDDEEDEVDEEDDEEDEDREEDDEVMSLLGAKTGGDRRAVRGRRRATGSESSPDGGQGESEQSSGAEELSGPENNNSNASASKSGKDGKTSRNGSGDGSFDDESNMDLLRQYIAVDSEINQLEDRDALRIYHEKIDQLEQLERELDMISGEAEEMASRSELRTGRSLAATGQPPDENNSVTSAPDSRRSTLRGISRARDSGTTATGKRSSKPVDGASLNSIDGRQTDQRVRSMATGNVNNQPDINNKTAPSNTSTVTVIPRPVNSAYSTIEDVFNRKIILEKERDKLKKEVEQVILECDKLQQRYKRRDEILDKLFDGRTGNGLENHLERQLNWLLEQKHYVDQVFYAWKRAETLTSETCEQFANALELLKRMADVEEVERRRDLAKGIEVLLVKSKQDMEQAQRYNPNVDAPFFTENETERFDKIIETISSSSASISATEYSQIFTVLQFAYKRAVSIRLWLEQILQTTIARDSFELSEEYKWISIQLRKERINLIKTKLQESPLRSMAATIQQQVARQMAEQQAAMAATLSVTSAGTTSARSSSRNVRSRRNLVSSPGNARDSGLDSDQNNGLGGRGADGSSDIEEEIYRVLELNRARLEQQAAAGKSVPGEGSSNNPTSGSLSGNGVKPAPTGSLTATGSESSFALSSKLKVELDEASRRLLLEQVDQSHNKHRGRLERLRGTNRSKATDSIMNRMLLAGAAEPETSAAQNSGTSSSDRKKEGSQADR